MADPIMESKIVAILLGIIKSLAMSVEMMAEIVPKPVFLDDEPERKRWRFEKPDPYILQVLMCVRTRVRFVPASFCWRAVRQRRLGCSSAR